MGTPQLLHGEPPGRARVARGADESDAQLGDARAQAPISLPRHLPPRAAANSFSASIDDVIVDTSRLLHNEPPGRARGAQGAGGSDARSSDARAQAPRSLDQSAHQRVPGRDTINAFPGAPTMSLSTPMARFKPMPSTPPAKPHVASATYSDTTLSPELSPSRSPKTPTGATATPALAPPNQTCYWIPFHSTTGRRCLNDAKLAFH